MKQEAIRSTSLSRTALAADDLGSAVRLARQAAGQITAGIPGWKARLCRLSLTDVLIAAGDVGAAEGMCAAGLAASRDTGSQESLAELLNMMALRDLRAGRIQDAAAHLREALQVELRTGDWTDLQNSLDCCGLLCAAAGRCAEAITLWAAWAALSRYAGFIEWPADTRLRQQPLSEARRALGPAPTRTAEDRVAAMTLQTAAEYALLLTGPGPSQPAGPGPGRLSARERELVTLVARGRTDAQIAAELHISIRTVRSHLDRIRDKTGCRRRADLTRLALTAALI